MRSAAFRVGLVLLCIGCAAKESAPTLKTSEPASEPPTAATRDQSSTPAVGLSQDFADEILSLASDLESGREVSVDRIETSIERINQAKGFTVVLCANVLAPLMADNETLSVGRLALITSAAAMIKEPELESNLPAMATASLESLARIYGQALAKGGAEMPAWDQLAGRVAAGQLAQWVSAEWACPMTVEEARGLKPADAVDSEPVVVPYSKP